MNRRMQPFSINLHPYQLEKLKLLSKEQDRTVAYLIRLSIGEFLGKTFGDDDFEHTVNSALNNPLCEENEA